MPRLIIDRVSEPRGWVNNMTKKLMLGYFLHGTLDGTPCEGTMNCVDPGDGSTPKNAPKSGEDIEVTVRSNSVGIIFSRVSQFNKSTGGYTPGREQKYDDISDLVQKRSDMQPVDANSCIARAIEFVTKDPAFSVSEEDWVKVAFYAHKAAELQKQLLANT